MSRQSRWIALTLIMLVAAALRLCGLGLVPPGLSHDEVANWLIAQDILKGDHAIYFTAAYGHEPLFQYAQAGTVALFGDHWLGLRWPSFAFSLLGIAATYALIRYLFDCPVALLTVSWLAVSFWPVFYARVAYRAILLPFTAALSAYFLFRVIRPKAHQTVEVPNHRSRDVLLAGFFLGLSAYTYMAARILPLILATVVVYAKLSRPNMSVPWSRVCLILLIGALISAPLWLWLAAHPGAEHRIAEVRQPFDRLIKGDASLAWQNLIANLKSFVIAGDPWPRYNIPGRPVFAEPVGATLFLTGLLIAIWRWRNLGHGVLLIWLIGSLGPSVVTSRAPSSIRDILGLIATFAFPALAVVAAGRWAKARLLGLKSPMRRWMSFLPHLLAILTLAPSLFLTARDYFFRWPQEEVARFDYQADLFTLAKWLEGLPTETSVTVAGLSVHTMDGPTLELASRWDTGDVRLCDTRETLIIPSTQSGDAWLLIPQIVPLDEDLREQLLNWEMKEYERPSFASYRLTDDSDLRRNLRQLRTRAALPNGVAAEAPVSYGGHLEFLGYREQERTNLEDPLTLLTYWRVEDPPSAQLTVFAHLIDATGELAAQDDGLASPSDRWRTDDIVIQKHILPLRSSSSRSSECIVRVGVYENATETRLPVLTADHLELAVDAR